MCRLSKIYTLYGPWLRLEELCAGTTPPPPMRGLDIGFDADDYADDTRDERREREHEQHDLYVREDEP